MNYFVVIGTNNNVKCVVDEIKKSHLQHNVITSGCILYDKQDTFYHWDVFNAKGEKTKEHDEAIELHDALTNQISQFKTLLPQDVTTQVFVVSSCFDEKECETLQMVCNELYQIGGAMLSGIYVNIILLGYDVEKAEDVTKRPHWRLLESIRGLGVASRFTTNILYINNIDLRGAATNLDSCILGRFLSHWSKMLCAGGPGPASGICSKVYAIGISEHQYDFRDLNEFFKLAAEKSLLDRTLSDNPSRDTQELLKYKYYSKIDLDLRWIDGLPKIKEMWNSYCSTEWNPKEPLVDNVYSLARQEQELASYLNQFLRLYIKKEEASISNLEAEKAKTQAEICDLSAQIQGGNEDPAISEKIKELKGKLEKYQEKIQKHRDNIRKNVFNDANSFYESFGRKEQITKEDEKSFEEHRRNVLEMIKHVKLDECVDNMREAIRWAAGKGEMPCFSPYPESAVENVGRVEELKPAEAVSRPEETIVDVDTLEKRSGCLFWFKSLFSKKEKEEVESEEQGTGLEDGLTNAAEPPEVLQEELGKAVAALKKADEVHAWWGKLCETIDRKKSRREECVLLMDGEQDANGIFVKGKEGYIPKSHAKSVSLIDMDRVRRYRDGDSYYKKNISILLNRWFNKEGDKDVTELQLIKHQVLDPLLGRFHTLNWDGNNPFVDELMSDDTMKKYIDSDLKESKPFVEYVCIQESNVASNLSIGFYSNKPDVPTLSNEFKKKYNPLSPSSSAISPVYLPDFVNSLCVVQLMNIPDHVDSLKDFKPGREYHLGQLFTDISNEIPTIVGNANTVKEKAKAIYDWLCNNIAYDTTKQIHDAETCWKLRRGVCQAYCELFCHIAEKVGVTADVVIGQVKSPQGEISDEKHAWLYIYTQAYDGIFVDPTWGAGSVDGVKFVRNEDNSLWFDVSPYWMAFTHMPDQIQWAKLDIDISLEQFKGLPYKVPSNESDGKDVLFESLSALAQL